MSQIVSPQTVKAWLDDGNELAFIDVREHGQYGEAHPFFVSSVPFSRFELLMPQRVPNPAVRLVLLDNGDGVAQRAAAVAARLGYSNVSVVDGGAPGWAQAGYTLYAGVNVPSKAFAEVMELARHTPALPAEQVAALQASANPPVILDGRPLTEFNKMSIPGASCCPNGELALRIHRLVQDEQTTIIVNCAGRTRSIIGAQTLIDAGVKNPVYALENGTQGWVLAGLERAHGESARYPADLDADAVAEKREAAAQLADSVGVGRLDAADLAQWLQDAARTTYVLDVRTPEEFNADGSPLSVHAPGGQLVQGTDEWIGVRGARTVLIDADGVRAPMTAYWLAQIGHDVQVLNGGLTALQTLHKQGFGTAVTAPDLPGLAGLSAAQAADAQLVDLRGSLAYRKAHIDGARWSVRPAIDKLALDAARPVGLIGDHDVCALVAADLTALGITTIGHLPDDESQWQADGFDIVQSPALPADVECIDHLFFTAERHTGNLDHNATR